MIYEKNYSDYQELIKAIVDANHSIQQYAEESFSQVLKFHSPQEQGLLDLDKLTFFEQTTDQIQQKNSEFFSEIPLITLDEQNTYDRIKSIKKNYVSSKRKDQLFKRHKKQQQQKLCVKKKQIEKYYGYKNNIQKGLKGEFSLKRGDQIHTCTITSDDLEKLRPETDLNDTIIANYLKILQTEFFSEELQKKIFIYSSFFFQKLVGDLFKDDGAPNNERQAKSFSQKIKLKVRQNYKNIKRWTRKVDIFQKQYLVIPINAFKHWYCVIISNPQGLYQKNYSKRPSLIYCDSMFEKRPFIIDAIRTYLEVEMEDKKSKSIEIQEEDLPCYQLLLPRQTNTHDCGLYMLTYIENLLMNTKQLENLEKFINRSKLHIFPRTIIFSMRQRLKQLFINLIQSTDETARKQILKKYKQSTQKIIQQAQKQDFDNLDMRQFSKYEGINSRQLFDNQQSQQGKQFACKIRFYLDPQVNFYQRDKV